MIFLNNSNKFVNRRNLGLFYIFKPNLMESVSWAWDFYWPHWVTTGHFSVQSDHWSLSDPLFGSTHQAEFNGAGHFDHWSFLRMSDQWSFVTHQSKALIILGLMVLVISTNHHFWVASRNQWPLVTQLWQVEKSWPTDPSYQVSFWNSQYFWRYAFMKIGCDHWLVIFLQNSPLLVIRAIFWPHHCNLRCFLY